MALTLALTALPELARADATDEPVSLPLVEEFTAHTLKGDSWQLGTQTAYGITDTLTLGIDPFPTLLGAPSVLGKWQFFGEGDHHFAMLLNGTYVDRKSLIWGAVRDNFDELNARVAQLGFAWSRQLSPRLELHTLWLKSFGPVHATLSEHGRRSLWEAKHPDGDYDVHKAETDQNKNPDNKAEPEKPSSSPALGTLAAQSLAGLATDVFQISGEIRRKSGNKIVLISRMERLQLEELRGNTIRLTAAQQWIWPTFSVRLGIGTQYLIVSGHDLDGEKLDAASFLPASDVEFYWTFN